MSDKEIEEAFEEYLQTLSIFPAFTPETMTVAIQAFKAGVRWERERKLDSKFKTSTLYFVQEEQVKKLEAELKTSEFSPKTKFYQERCEWLEKRLFEAENIIEFYGSLRCPEREDDCDRYLPKRAKTYLEKYKVSNK